MAWYKEWFGDDYLDLYAHRNAEEAREHVDFVLRVLKERPRTILDLACGAGRHTTALRRRGIRTFGLDISIRLLALEPTLPAVAGDMGFLPFADQSFDWVLNLFTSYGYFETEEENFRVLQEIVRVLRPGGRFFIDFLNRDQVLAELNPSEVLQRGERTIKIERWYDASTRRINKRIHVEEPAATRTFLESVRAYGKDEVIGGLARAGLQVTEIYGNFLGDPYQRDSERLILVGQRPA